MNNVALIWKSILLRVRLGERRKLASLVAILAIAIGIASIVTSLAVLRALVYDIYPYPHLGQLVYVGPTTRFENHAIAGTSVANYLDIVDRVKSYSEIGYIAQSQHNLGTESSPERIRTMFVTPSIFHMFGARPIRGRTLTADDCVTGHDDVAVITYRAWQNQFGADPAILGRMIRLNDRQFKVVGVLPPDMYFMMKSYEIFLPFVVTNESRAESRRGDLTGTIFARLRPGVPLAAARQEIRGIRDMIISDHPELGSAWNTTDSRVVFNVDTIRENTFRFGTMWIVQVAAYSILGLSILVLSLCALNLLTMMLAETASRVREFAIRTSVGASRQQICVQLICESIIQYLVGWAVGVLLALLIVPLLRAGIEANEISGRLQVDWVVAGIGLGAALALGVLSAIVLTRLFVKPQPLTGLQATPLTLVGRGQRAMLATLIVGQLSVAFALLASASFMRITTDNVMSIKPGFATKDALVAKVEFPEQSYPDASRLTEATDEVLTRLRQLPDVVSVAASSAVPLNGGVAIEHARPGGSEPTAAIDIREYDVTDGYFDTMSILLKGGRYLDATDRQSSTPSVVIDEALANRFFAGRSVIGEELIVGSRACRIVGVVGVVKHQDFREEFTPGSVYFDFNQSHYPRSPIFVVRTRPGHKLDVPAAIRKAIFVAEPLVPRFDVTPIDQAMQNVINVRERLISLVMMIGGAMATLLATLGSYGLLAFLVELQTREFGIRIALGSTPENILGRVMRTGFWYVGWGIGFGIVMTFLCTKLMAKVLYGVGPLSWTPYMVTALEIAVATMAAVLIPGVRAMRMSPMQALKTE